MGTGPYGVSETNPLPVGFHEEKEVGSVDWTDKRLLRIERLRLLSDPGYPFWDVSYCYGRLKDGSKVRVGLPFSELPKKNMMGALIEHAKRDKVYLKGLGVFDAISTLN
jgi:hypothetical protein